MKKRSMIALNLLMILIILFLHIVVMTGVYHGFRQVAAESSFGDAVGYNVLTLSYPIRGEGGIIISTQIFDLTIPFIVLLMIINVVLFIKEKNEKLTRAS